MMSMLVIVCMITTSFADIYLHNPAGSNNRNRYVRSSTLSLSRHESTRINHFTEREMRIVTMRIVCSIHRITIREDIRGEEIES